MFSTRSLTTTTTALDQILRRSRIQGRRTARQVGFAAQRRGVSSTAFAGAKRTNFFLEWYSAKLDAYPLMTKAITSGIIAAAGDVLCQVVVAEENEDGKKSWNPWRTMRFAAVGAFWVAPAVHYWYGALTHKLLPGAATPLRVAQRVAADQFGFGPIFTSSFISILWLLEGRWQEDAKGTLNNLTETMPGVLVTGWKLWVPAMAINFGVVPFKYQVLYTNVLSLFWNAYLSFISSSDAKTIETVRNDDGPVKLAHRLTLPTTAASRTTVVVTE